MFERFEGTQNPQFAHNMASALCLVSDPVVDRAKLVQLAERGLSVRRTPWRLATLATAYCRSGDYKKAVDRLLELDALSPGWSRISYYSLLAMAYHGFGKPDLARQSLQSATAWVEWRNQAMFQSPPGELTTSWWDLQQSTLHYREAKKLIDGQEPMEDARLRVVRARALAALGREREAVAGLGQAIPQTPKDEADFYTLVLGSDPDGVWAYEQPATARVRLKQWDGAARDFADAVQRRPDDVNLWYCRAAAALGADNLAAYQTTRAAILERFRDTSNAGVASHLLYVCVAAPADTSEHARLIRLGELGIKSTPGNPRVL